MSYTLKTGETVNLNALARKATSTPVTETVKVLSNSEKVRKYNDLSALHTLIKVRGV